MKDRVGVDPGRGVRDMARPTAQRDRAVEQATDGSIPGDPATVVVPRFDPESGTTVVEPLGKGPGWWAGAPGVHWTGDRYYLSYRLRRPQPERGGETRIAVGEDGVHFTTIWSARKEAFATSSIERCAVVQGDDGGWRLYVSYVDGADGRWRIDLIEADDPDAFDPATRTPVFTAGDIGAEGVKDPWLTRVDGEWQMIVSFAPAPERETGAGRLHGTQDVYNTGLTKSLTGLASSNDGRSWQWHGAILEPHDGAWDAYAARINSAVRVGGAWVGYYDGSASVAENYEERCGAVVGNDLRQWQRVSLERPFIGASQMGPGSVRYVEAVHGPGWIRYYYEYTRPDGSHELRTSVIRFLDAPEGE